MDTELKKFYDSVKDPSWPEVKNYVDFYKLPTDIKAECNKLHKFQERKAQIADCDFWAKSGGVVYQYQNLVYVPIAKCASTYYTTFFDSNGWIRKSFSEIDPESVVMFGLLKDPFDRWVKGITEWIASTYYDCLDYPTTKVPNELTDVAAYRRTYTINKAPLDWIRLARDFENTSLKNIIDTVIIGDSHSMPYSLMLGNYLHRINWIPMDFLSDNDIKKSLMLLFQKCNHTIDIPLDNTRAWESSSDKLKLENIIKESYLNSKERAWHLYKLYSPDLKFYYNLIDTFDPTWQRIKGNTYTKTEIL